MWPILLILYVVAAGENPALLAPLVIVGICFIAGYIQECRRNK